MLGLVLCTVLSAMPADAQITIDSTRVRVMNLLNPRRRILIPLVDTAAHGATTDTVVEHTARDSLIQKIWPAIMQLGAAPFYVYEYHDEQKFIVGENYGPMVHVFVSPYIGSFTHVRQFDTHGAAGILIGILYVDAPTGTALGQPYVALSLQAGLNCLHLAHVRGDSPRRSPTTGWRAYITPAAADTTCPHDYNVAELTPLQVQARRIQGAGAFDDYPNAARFSDDSLGRPLVGIKCITAWCEIGPSRGFTAIPPGHSGDATLPKDREHGVKGWHDEQRLAVVAAGKLVPSRIRASVIPSRGLDTLDERDFENAVIRVGKVWINADPDRTSLYYTNWGLRKGVNWLYTRKVENTWVGWIRNAQRDSVAVRVVRKTHWDVAIPGTARWRFGDGDETIWYDCGGACCEMYAISR